MQVVARRHCSVVGSREHLVRQILIAMPWLEQQCMTWLILQNAMTSQPPHPVVQAWHGRDLSWDGADLSIRTAS
jgi:hypothetical protein